jgi:hypothetical protein
MDSETERQTKYCIAICQPYNVFIHGRTEDSNEFIDRHFILEEFIGQNLFYSWSYEDLIHDINSINSSLGIDTMPSLEIVEPIELPTGEYVACIKTFWLKILQRKWKKVFEERKQKLKHLKNLNNLLKRERFTL